MSADPERVSLAARAAGLPWALAARARVALYRHGYFDVKRLDAPVISVGALEMGGTGKTPAVAALAALLQEMGHRPAILSRGYGRQGQGPTVVSAGDGPLVGSSQSGDEPQWYARWLKDVPVAVAARREQAADLVRAVAPRVDAFVLDDGFQHVRVARDTDLLVVDADRPFWHAEPPPGGRLREGPSAAARAHAFLLVGGNQEGIRQALAERFPGRPAFALHPEQPGCWALADYLVGRPAEISDSLTGKVVAFAGIARPDRFYAGLRAAGIDLVGTNDFRDHHPFDGDDLMRLTATAQRQGATALVTTEKDAVRLAGVAPGPVPLHVWRYRLRAAQPAALSNWLRPRFGTPRQVRP